MEQPAALQAAMMSISALQSVKHDALSAELYTSK
jgi:hypothetical protein